MFDIALFAGGCSGCVFSLSIGIWSSVGSVRYSFCVPDFIFQSMTISQTCRHKAHLANFVNFFYFFINFLTACCCSMLDFSSVSLRGISYTACTIAEAFLDIYLKCHEVISNGEKIFISRQFVCVWLI